MNTLKATQDIRKVALWLGHESLQSTQIYLRSDLQEKFEIINKISPIKMRKGRFKLKDKVLELLKRHSLCCEKTKVTPITVNQDT